jgi:hypothetical protein
MDPKRKPLESPEEAALDEALEESFPASDPPATTPGHAGEPAPPLDPRNVQTGNRPSPGDGQVR